MEITPDAIKRKNKLQIPFDLSIELSNILDYYPL